MKKQINKKFVVLAEYFEEQTNCSRYRTEMSQSRRSPLWRDQSHLPFLIKQNGSHTTVWCTKVLFNTKFKNTKLEKNNTKLKKNKTKLRK